MHGANYQENSKIETTHDQDCGSRKRNHKCENQKKTILEPGEGAMSRSAQDNGQEYGKYVYVRRSNFLRRENTEEGALANESTRALKDEQFLHFLVFLPEPHPTQFGHP